METTPSRKFPFMEQPYTAFILAIICGIMDAYTLKTATTHATVMSGNIVSAGFDIGSHDFTRWHNVILAILSFGIGSMATALIQEIVFDHGYKESWSFWVIMVEVVLLVLLGFGAINQQLSPWHIACIVSFIAGMQGNAFHEMDGMLYGNIAVTLVVQLAFNYFMLGILGEKGAFRLGWFYFQVLIGLAFGAYIGILMMPHIDEKVLWVAAALLVLVASFAKIMKDNNPQFQIDENTSQSYPGNV